MQEADLQKLETELEAMHAAAMAQNLDGIAVHSVAFHEIIVKAARNELLYTVWKSLCIETRTTVTLMAAGDNLLELADSHRTIIETIKSGDVEAACRAARDHQDIFEHLPVLEEDETPIADPQQPAA